jgi:V/A-type H+-transporting ATPase subunit A
VKLGPGLLGGIFDGLLRPLTGTDDFQIQAGLGSGAAGRFRFVPQAAVGAALETGEILGAVAAAREQLILVPPGVDGKLEWLAAEGEYGEDEVIARLAGANGRTHEVAMRHPWPVRTPRPVRTRLPASGPMITGQRILDTLFPVARGSRAALPGGFGTGKTVLQEALAKWCDADVIVYVGCGERGNEMAEVLDEFPQLEDPRTGRPLAERTVIIANTSNMPVAAREASIYTAISVAEYFRDQGLHVALMADSTSRWAEALREVSGRLGELPGEAGYPAYLSSRLAEFYERAARVTTLGGKEGSVTIIGAVSPPAGDFSEPVTLHTKRYVRCFWALDRQRAQARFYPAIHPLLSYSADADALAEWWKHSGGNPDWLTQRQRVLSLLEQQAHLERMARIVGRDALPAQQQLKLLCADLVNDGFLRQSSFSKVDRYCSPGRQAAMISVLLAFMDRAEAAVQSGVAPARIAELPVVRQLQRLGEEYGEGDLRKLSQLPHQLDYEFDSLHTVAANVR